MAAKKMILANFLDYCCESQSKNNVINSFLHLKRKRFVLLLLEQNIPRKVPKNRHFAAVIEEMPDDVFFSHFRMNNLTFKKLHSLLAPFWIKSHTGRPGMPLKVSLYITLWKLANQNSFREVSDRFNVGVGACYRAFLRCLNIISTQKQIVEFPNTTSSQKKVVEDFESLRFRPFPFVMGCIDCTHFKILQPSKNSISYFDRKGTYSIIAQAVVDSKLRFLDIFVGYPGRCHDAAVWRASPLRRAITNGLVMFPSECHLLGDAAYPLETFLMVPYRDNGFLSSAQSRYNAILSSTRVCVEQAFGILKKKFKILSFLEVCSVELAKKIIMSCVILHNFILNNDESSVLINIDLVDENSSSQPNNLPAPQHETEEARLKRERLTILLSA